MRVAVLMKFFVAVPVQGEAENIFQVLKDGTVDRWLCWDALRKHLGTGTDWT